MSDTSLVAPDDQTDEKPMHLEKENPKAVCTHQFQRKWCFSDSMCVRNSIVYAVCPPYGNIFWTECGKLYYRNASGADAFGPQAEDVITGETDANSANIEKDLPNILTGLDHNHGNSDLHQFLRDDTVPNTLADEKGENKIENADLVDRDELKFQRDTDKVTSTKTSKQTTISEDGQNVMIKSEAEEVRKTEQTIAEKQDVDVLTIGTDNKRGTKDTKYPVLMNLEGQHIQTTDHMNQNTPESINGNLLQALQNAALATDEKYQNIESKTQEENKGKDEQMHRRQQKQEGSSGTHVTKGEGNVQLDAPTAKQRDQSSVENMEIKVKQEATDHVESLDKIILRNAPIEKQGKDVALQKPKDTQNDQLANIDQNKIQSMHKQINANVKDKQSQNVEVEEQGNNPLPDSHGKNTQDIQESNSNILQNIDNNLSASDKHLPQEKKEKDKAPITDQTKPIETGAAGGNKVDIPKKEIEMDNASLKTKEIVPKLQRKGPPRVQPKYAGTAKQTEPKGTYTHKRERAMRCSLK